MLWGLGMRPRFSLEKKDCIYLTRDAGVEAELADCNNCTILDVLNLL